MSSDNPFVDNKSIECKEVVVKENKEVEVKGGAQVKAYTGDEMVSYDDVITFDTDVKLNIVEKFSLTKDQKSVIAFVLFDQKGSPQLKMSQVYYDEPTKTLFRAPKDKSLLLKVAGKLGEPKIRFATVILRYLTDQRGGLLKPAQGQKPYDLVAYIFSTDKFPQFKEIHNRWDLKEYDLLLTCSDEKYQKISIIPAQKCYYKANVDIANSIINEAREMFDKGLNRFLGRELKEEEIMAIVEDTDIGEARAIASEGYNPFANNAQSQVGVSDGRSDFSDIVKSPSDIKTDKEIPF